MFLTANGRKLALLTAATAAVAGGASAPAMASAVTLNYSCELPYIGQQPTSATINLNYPDSVPANTPVPGQAISNTVSLNGDSNVMFEIVGAATVEGVNKVGVAYTSSAGTLPTTIPAAVPPVALQPSPAIPVLPGTGQTPQISFPAGSVVLNAGALSSILQVKDSSGATIQLDESAGAGDGNPDTFTTACTQLPGQNTQLDAFTAGTVVNAPTVTRILPRTVKANKKSTVVITGTKLKNATAVKVGGVAATFTVINKRLISAKVPALPAGTYPLTVTTPGGTSAVTAQTTVTYN